MLLDLTLGTLIVAATVGRKTRLGKDAGGPGLTLLLPTWCRFPPTPQTNCAPKVVTSLEKQENTCVIQNFVFLDFHALLAIWQELGSDQALKKGAGELWFPCSH